jgi:hypothetical protein
MPSNLRIGVSPDTSVSKRTVLYPTEILTPIMKKRVPQAGTSSRRQWLVQVKGPLGQRRHIVEFPPNIAQVTLGSGGACRCQVSHASVSRLHAALVRRAHRGVYLVDLSSREGTYLNGERVTNEVLLMDGDRISLGNKVEFEFLDGPRQESRVRRWAKRVWFAASGISVEP